MTNPQAQTNTKGIEGQAGASKVRIGRFTYGFESLQVKQWGEAAPLDIGAFCSLGQGITIFLGGNHRADWITTFPFGHVFRDELGGADIVGHPATRGGVRIGNDVWIGEGATLMSGITIGDGAVIATRAVVTQDVPPYGIVGGNPARLIRKRFDEELIERLLRLSWWELPLDDIRRITHRLSQPPSAALLDELIARYRP